MKYLFILGRNVELSKREVICYLERIGNEILGSELNGNGFLVETSKEIDTNTVDFLGGTISIGKSIASFDEKNLERELEKIMIYKGTENKLTYSVWDFSKGYEKFIGYLKDRFRSEKLKATLKHMTSKVKLQNGEKFEVPSSKLIEEEYFLYDYKEEVLFGEIFQKCDYNELEKRDMKKPVRRESLAISPRLAKILINLSGIKTGETLLDPFCGVGTVLSEGLLQGIKVIGIDKDKKAISGARENLEWFKFNKKDYELINGNSVNSEISGANAIATEPDLGETLKKIPTKDKAKKILNEFENLMIGVIDNFKDSVSGKVVFTSPYIRIGKKRISCEINKILESTGYKLTFEGIPEFRENQVVGRVIYVLEK